MSPRPDARRSVVRFWEAGRVAFNVAISAVAAFCFLLGGAVSAGVGDVPQLSDGEVGTTFLQWLVAANVLYSLAYALEFFFRSEDVTTRWNRYGRVVVFVVGISISVLIAAFSGLVVAQMMYTPSGGPG